MSSFVPSNYDMRIALVFCFRLTKSAAESHRMLVKAYGEHVLGKSQCYEWFNKFKCGDFDVKNEERGRPRKKFQDFKLQALLDENDGQTQGKLAEQLNVSQKCISDRLKAMGKKGDHSKMNGIKEENKMKNKSCLSHKQRKKS